MPSSTPASATPERAPTREDPAVKLAVSGRIGGRSAFRLAARRFWRNANARVGLSTCPRNDFSGTIGFSPCRRLLLQCALGARARPRRFERLPVRGFARACGGLRFASKSGERFPRSKFLEFSTLGLGGVIGGLVTVPALGFMIAPAYVKQGYPKVDLGPLANFTEGKWFITSFFQHPDEGEVSRRTAYIRYNGLLGGEPSFTIISNRCAHLGCPVQPNGPQQPNEEKTVKEDKGQVITMIPMIPAGGFGCPCHGGQYDPEGNRTSGPPVRGLDRYEYSIIDGKLWLGKPYSVAKVIGQGKDARIQKYQLTGPGQHVDGWEQILYPLQPRT